MPVEQGGDNISGQPDSQSLEQTPVQATRNKDIPTDAANSSPQQNQPTIIEIEKDIKSGEKWLIGIGVATILINIGIGAIYYGQLTEMRKATTASEKAATAADLSSKTANATLKEMQSEAKATSEAALASFKQEQRAYISTTNATANATDPVIVGPIGQKYYCMDVHFVNGGRTPAIGTWVTREATFGANVKGTIEGLKIPTFPTSISNMDGPGSDEWVSGCTDAVDAATLALLQRGRIDVYVYGAIQYRDIFGDSHETGFCYVRRSGFTPFMGCEFGNWFDKRPNQKGRKNE